MIRRALFAVPLAAVPFAQDAETSRGLLQRYIDDVLTRGDIGAIEALVSPDYPGGVDALKQRRAEGDQNMRSSITDPAWRVDHLIAEGDAAAARGALVGTKTADGSPVEVRYLLMIRAQDGKIAELWAEIDVAAMAAVSLPGPPPLPTP